jgi:hypothetical protein
MKHPTTVLFCLVLILAFVFFYSFQGKQPSTRTPVAATKSDSAKTVRQMEHQEHLPSIAGMVMTPVPLASNTNKNPYAQKPKEEVVEFKVVNGFAIAYGDTLLGKAPPDFDAMTGHSESPRVQLWDKSVIPYSINPSLPAPQRVQKAIDYFNQHTPVRFIPYDGSQPDALVFEPGEEECLSYIGRTGGLQPIRLVRNCGTQEILHEIMHALGFIHEQSRPDRDQYVEILWPNIDEHYQSEFAIVPDSLFESERDSPFDYRSIMMYRPSVFSVHSGLNTMQSVVKSSQINPVSEGLSDTDIARVNRLYGGGN